MRLHKKRRGSRKAVGLAATDSGGAMGAAARFLRTTFYYLKGEQLLKTSTRILCRAL